MHTYIAFISFLALSQAHFRPNPFGSSIATHTTYDVDVGKNGLTFEPSVLHAQVGDTINFHFFPSNHSVAESSFDKPCQPKVDVTNKVLPIFSGFVPVQDGASKTMFSMKLNTSAPTWLYCSQSEHDHCKIGQVMVINPPSNGAQTLQAYINASTASSGTTSPKDIYGGTWLKNTAASPNVTATGVDVATQTKGPEATENLSATLGLNAWFVLGIGTAVIAAL